MGPSEYPEEKVIEIRNEILVLLKQKGITFQTAYPNMFKEHFNKALADFDKSLKDLIFVDSCMSF